MAGFLRACWRAPILVSAMALFAVSIATACGDDGGGSTGRADVTAPAVTPASTAGLTLASDAFSDGETIPERYTCADENISPPLRWSGAPEDTAAFVLLMDDPDAPGGTFDHWVVYDLPPSTTGLPAGVPAQETVAGGGTQGTNELGRTGYFGPCPPEGPAHRYQFRLFALDAPLNLGPGKSKAEVEEAMRTHILAQTMLTGLFSR